MPASVHNAPLLAPAQIVSATETATLASLASFQEQSDANERRSASAIATLKETLRHLEVRARDGSLLQTHAAGSGPRKGSEGQTSSLSDPTGMPPSGSVPRDGPVARSLPCVKTNPNMPIAIRRSS